MDSSNATRSAGPEHGDPDCRAQDQTRGGIANPACSAVLTFDRLLDEMCRLLTY